MQQAVAYKQALKSATISGSVMTGPNSKTSEAASWFANPKITGLVSIVAVQALAAIYFLLDGIGDIVEKSTNRFSFEILMDCVVAFALIAGLVVGSRHFRKTADEIRRKDISLEIARGALSQQIARRFEEWSLTSGEAEVALFAMKGCNVAEIAGLRNSAKGTVRAQLSQIYSKAGVSSQSMLVSSFIEDLLG